MPREVVRVTERSTTVVTVGVTTPVLQSWSVEPLVYTYTVPEMLSIRDKSRMLDPERQQQILEWFTGKLPKWQKKPLSSSSKAMVSQGISQQDPALFHKFLSEKKAFIKDPDTVLLILKYLLKTSVIEPKISASTKTVCETLLPWKNDMCLLVAGEQSSLRVQAGILDMLVGFFDRDTDKFCNVLAFFIQSKFIREAEFHLWQDCTSLDSVNQIAKMECAAKAKLLLRPSNDFHSTHNMFFYYEVLNM